MKSISEKYSNIIEKLYNFADMYNQNIKNIELYEKETIDLLHEIEISKEVKPKYYKDLKKCREKRRKCKDDNEIIEPLLRVFDRNKQIKNEFFKAIVAIKKIEKTKLQRYYKPLVRKDLTIPTIKNELY